MKRILIAIASCIILAGCALSGDHAAAPNAPRTVPVAHGMQDLRLQYRIWQDAFAPSRFVAVFPDGMTSGLRIDWEIGAEEKSWMDARLAQLEEEGPNGREFAARGKWIVHGYHLEVHEIQDKLESGPRD